MEVHGHSTERALTSQQGSVRLPFTPRAHRLHWGGQGPEDKENILKASKSSLLPKSWQRALSFKESKHGLNWILALSKVRYGCGLFLQDLCFPSVLYNIYFNTQMSRGHARNSYEQCFQSYEEYETFHSAALSH